MSAEPAHLRSLPTWWLVIGLMAVAVVGATVAVDLAETGAWKMVDLDVYRWGGGAARTGDDLYTGKAFGLLQFTYSPFAAATFIPFSLISLATSKIIMVTLSVVALFATVGISLRSLGYRMDAGWLGATLALGALGASLEPVRETLQFGQINLILMAVIVGDLCLPDRSRWKGIGVGLATGFKLTPAIFIPYLLVTGRWRAALRAAVTAVGTVAVGFIILPSESSDYWFGRLFMDSTRVGGASFVSNQSINGLLARITGTVADAAPYWWVAVVVIVSLGLWVASRVQRRGPELAGILTCALIGLLVSPVSWSHHWVWVVPALVLAVDTALRRSPWAWAAVGAIVLAFSDHLRLIWQVPNRRDRELGWTTSQALQGNLYLLMGLALFGLAAWYGFRRRTGDDTAAGSGDGREDDAIRA